MNYKCECCDVSFRTPNDQARHLLTSKHMKNVGLKTPTEYETELVALKHAHQIEVMKLQHKNEILEVKNEMLQRMVAMKQEHQVIQPQEEDLNIEGREFYKISDEIKEHVELCDPTAFRKDNKEQDQEMSIFNLNNNNTNDDSFNLYSLFCELMESKGDEQPINMFMNYLEDFIQPEDYKISSNMKKTDRLYLIKTPNTWYTETESNRQMEDLIGCIKNKLNEFTNLVFRPIRDKYKTETTQPLSIMNNAWWVKRGIVAETIIKKLVKNKKDSMSIQDSF